MDINSTTQIISSLGFPIFCTVALGFFIYKSYANITANNKEREVGFYKVIGEQQVVIEKALETNAKLAQSVDLMLTELRETREDIESIKETIKRLPKRKNDIVEEEGE